MMTATEARLLEMLKMICDRAHRPEQAGSTHHLTQRVPANLIENAKALIETVGGQQ